MDDDPIRLRMTAEMCRQLMRRITDAETVTRLTALAEQCEQRLQQLQDSSDTEPSPRRKPDDLASS
jgi:hypothetical protein